MKARKLRFLPVLILSSASVFVSVRCSAQAVPDTSLNNIIHSDSLARARRLPDTSANNSAAIRGAGDGNLPLTKITAVQPFQPIPKRAALFSAMLPGAGQFYNRQYWKIAVVYAGLGAATFFLIDNTQQYQKYRKAYVARLTDPTVQDEYTNLWSADPNITRQNLQTLQDFYKRNLDLTILLTGIGYTLQVIDALAFAHLHNFDVSRNISLRLKPVNTPLGAALGIVAVIR